MKRNSHSLGLIVSCLGLFALADVGHSQGFYFDASAGVAFAHDVDLRQFLVSTPHTKLELDPGPRLSVAGGYNFNSYLGVQLETGFIANNVKGVSSGGDIDAALAHVPMLADFVVRYDKPDCKWVPYAGVGAGGGISTIALDNVRAPNGAVVDGSDSDVVFAWQAFAGVRYKFWNNMSIGAGYKYYSAGNPTWDVRDSAGEIKTGRAQVHTVGVDFNMKF
ncbi:MAG TPA: porin family protein [Verrucomicrobiae bacterium]